MITSSTSHTLPGDNGMIATPTILGITGPIASGKSTFTAYIESRYQAEVFDCDAHSHHILESNLASVARLLNEKGANLPPSPTRSQIAQAVFAPSGGLLLKALEDYTWKLLKQKLEEELSEWRNEPSAPKLFIVDAALLFQAGLGVLCDKILVVTAPREDRLLRYLSRTGSTESDFQGREAAQAAVFDGLVGFLEHSDPPCTPHFELSKMGLATNMHTKVELIYNTSSVEVSHSQRFINADLVTRIDCFLRG